jgi:enoyl-CoA hydratase
MTVGTINLKELADGVMGVQVDRPPVNALNPAFLAEMDRVLETLAADDSVHAIVLNGAGKTLSGGMDLKELLEFSADDQQAMVAGLNRTLAALYGFPKPLICAANGAAIAGGLFLVLVSDYCIANARAVFALAEVRVGIRFPVGPFEIARNELAPHACRRIMLGGAMHDAQTALQLGVVDELAEGEDVMPRAIAVASEYATLPPRAFAHTKQQLRAEVLEKISSVLSDASEPLSDGWVTDETIAATQAVLAGLQRK